MIEQDLELVYPSELIAGCISIYRNVWNNTKEVIDQLEEYSNSNKTKVNWPFVPASLLDGSHSNKRTNYHMSLTGAASEDKKINKIFKDYHSLIFSTAIGYNVHFKIDEKTYFNEGFNVLKYQAGQEYTAHYDGPSASGRSISPILYLNDDYEGGELEFVNFGIKIKPEAGMLVIFPATYPYSHIAHPVTDGTKYAIVTWLHDRPLDTLSKNTLGM